MQHIIKKQVIDLIVDNTLDAFRVQQQWSDHYRQHLYDILETTFDEVCGPDEAIYIDRLEIDLGRVRESMISRTVWEDNWLAGIRQPVQDAVRKAIAQEGFSTTAPAARRSPARLNSYRQWLFYMQEGHLPWNLNRADEEWLRNVLEALATDYSSVTELRQLLPTQDRILTRIIRQHQPAFLVQLTEILTATRQHELPAAIREIQHIMEQLIVSGSVSSEGHIDPRRAVTETGWRHILRTAAVARPAPDTAQLVAGVLETYDKKEMATAIETLSAILPRLTILRPAVEQMIRELAARDMPVIKGKQKATPEPKADATPDIAGNDNITSTDKLSSEKDSDSRETTGAAAGNLQKEKETGTGQAPAREEKDRSSSDRADRVPTINKPPVDEEGIFVQQAGLVLVHPFLKSFFGLTGLLEGRHFVNALAQQKAIYLLHYVATGHITAEEHALVIPKLLCDHPPEEPVETMIDLSPQELQEADDLLRAVIAQWSLLKNTSPDGLREGFLQRNGKLFAKNGQLYITVEKSAIDVLLDHLPWNLGIIKLPWVNTLIRVEWR